LLLRLLLFHGGQGLLPLARVRAECVLRVIAPPDRGVLGEVGLYQGEAPRGKAVRTAAWRHSIEKREPALLTIREARGRRESSYTTLTRGGLRMADDEAV
jgi:hypothetical protein